MKAIIVLALLATTLLAQELESSTQIYDSVSCVQCISNFNSKVCIPSSGSSSRYCCDRSDFSYNCGTGTSGICSNDQYSPFPYNAQYILCPTENACNSQYYYLYSDYTTSISSQYVPQGGVCVYILQKNSNQYDGIKIIPTINQNVTMTIYSSTGTNKYKLEELVYGNSEIKIDVSSYASLYVVAKSDGTKIGKFMFKASLFKNPLSGGAIAGIVIGSIAFCVIFIVIVVCCVRSCKKRAQAKRIRLMNQGQMPQMIPNQPNIYQNQYNKPVPQPNPYNQPPYQQYPVSQPGSQPYAYVKPGYPENEPLLQNSPYQVSNTQQPAYPFMPQTNKYLPANPAYPTPGGKE